MIMEIYKVSTEFGFDCKILDSVLFSDKGRAMDYAQNLADERRGMEEYYMCNVTVDKLLDDSFDEFQFAETIICHEL